MQFLFHQLWSGQKVSFFSPICFFSCCCFHSCSSNASNKHHVSLSFYKILHLCSDFSSRKSAVTQYSRCSFCSTYLCQRTKQLQLNPVQEEMKNSFSVMWGGKEENEYPRIPMDFRGNMTLTLNRAWSKDDAPQPQGWSLIPQGDGTGQSWLSVGKSMGCSGDLAHRVTVVMTLSYQNPLWAQCLLYPRAKPSVMPGEPQCSCSVPSSEKQAQGLFLQRQPRRKSRGLAEAERLRGNCSSFARCAGNSVQESNKFLGLFTWSQLLTQFNTSGCASSQPPDRQQAGKKH